MRRPQWRQRSRFSFINRGDQRTECVAVVALRRRDWLASADAGGGVRAKQSEKIAMRRRWASIRSRLLFRLRPRNVGCNVERFHFRSSEVLRQALFFFSLLGRLHGRLPPLLWTRLPLLERLPLAALSLRSEKTSFLSRTRTLTSLSSLRRPTVSPTLSLSLFPTQCADSVSSL